MKTSLIALFLFCSAVGFAQSTPTTTLVGTVADATGAAIPNAALELTNQATHIDRKLNSDSQGRFVFSLVPPGVYDLQVAAQGFAPLRQSGIKLDVDVPVTLRLTISVAASATQVTVVADAPMVDSQSGTLRQVVDQQYIQDLPLNGRNAAALVFMAPGAVVGKGTDTATYATTSETQAVSVNGTMGTQVAYKLDGASYQDNITNLNAGFPNPEALQEFSVETNNFDARYGGSGGAVVNIVTRSGGNDIHGSAFEYLRNGDLNARNFFAAQQDAIKRNQFGGTFGGPIKKDKLFYFGSYQDTDLHNVSYSNTAFVPTAAQATGNFAGGKNITDPTTGKPFPGNIIPASEISPIATAMLQHVPQDPSGKILFPEPDASINQQVLAKADYNAGKHQLSASYFYLHYTDPGWNGNDTLLNYKLGQNQTTQSFKMSDTWSITPSLLNSLVFDGLILDSKQTRTSPFSIFDFGNINATKPVPEFQETGISVTSYSGWGTGSPQPPGEWIRNNTEISEVMTYVHGAHSMHFGGTYVPWTRFDSNTGYEEEPLLSFNGSVTGNGLGDLLLGKLYSYTQTAGKAKFTRGHQLNAFYQDQWRVTSRLTLNLGLRWDPLIPYTDPLAGQVGGYVPGAQSQRFPLAPKGLLFAGDPGFPSGGLYADYGNFAPRLGFAWTPFVGDHSTTIRGGWGMFYIEPMAKIYNNFVQNAPFSPSVSLLGVDLANPFGSAGVQNPFPPFAPVHPNASTTFILPLTYQYFDPHFHAAHTNTFNFTIEHQFARNLVLRASYVGTEGRSLPTFLEDNPGVYGPGATTANTNNRRPLYPTFASLIEMTNGGYSNYNAAQFSLQRRLAHGLTFVANYTFSKSLDNVSVDQQFTVTNPDPYNPNFNYGRADFDTTHNFSLWGIYDLPLLEHTNRLVRGAFGGWQTTAIWSWRSGTPLNILAGQDRSYSGISLDRGDIVGNPNLPSGRPLNQVLNEFFNTSAYTLNAIGTFGDSPRNAIDGPHLFNVDWSIAKSFRVRERFTMQVRGDFFNVFNNAEFSNPGVSVASTSTFGKITAASDPRIAQLSMRLRF